MFFREIQLILLKVYLSAPFLFSPFLFGFSIIIEIYDQSLDTNEKLTECLLSPLTAVYFELCNGIVVETDFFLQFALFPRNLCFAASSTIVDEKIALTVTLPHNFAMLSFDA